MTEESSSLLGDDRGKTGKQTDRQTQRQTDTQTASERPFEVEDFSPPEFSEAGNTVVEDHGGPEPSLFEPLAPAPALPEAGALGAEAVQVQGRM